MRNVFQVGRPCTLIVLTLSDLQMIRASTKRLGLYKFISTLLSSCSDAPPPPQSTSPSQLAFSPHEFLLRKRQHTFTLPHCTYNLYTRTPFSPVVFVSSCSFLWCCVSHYPPCSTVPVLIYCSRLMSNNIFTYLDLLLSRCYIQ